jgi:hypothetical protein
MQLHLSEVEGYRERHGRCKRSEIQQLSSVCDVLAVESSCTDHFVASLAFNVYFFGSGAILRSGGLLALGYG